MSDSRGVPTADGFRPYRHLALRVLVRALLDVVNPDGPSAHRESARTFLNGSGMLLHWCHVAALDPTVIAKLGEKLGRMETLMTAATDALPPIPGAREPGMLTTFLPARPVVAVPEGPSTMDAATIVERQREGGGAANQRRAAVNR